MKGLRPRLLLVGLIVSCADSPLTPDPLPVEAVQDTLVVAYQFARPVQFSPYDVGPPSVPTVTLESGTLQIEGRFYLPEGDFDQYARMAASAVRTRYYQGTAPFDSVGHIGVRLDGGPGAAWPAASGAAYEVDLYGMLPGRYRLTIELEGDVYNPGTLLDSIIVVP